MSDPKIHVTYIYNTDPKKRDFKYTDENGECAETKRHLSEGDIITWLMDSGAGQTMKISFDKNGNPFTPPTSDITVSGQRTKVNKDHSRIYNYTVYVLDSNNTVIDHDDPKIIFDDGRGMEGGSCRLGIPDPFTIATATQAAKAAWQDIFKDLQSAKAKAASGIVFYPYGINDIEATINAGPVSVTIKVSGPSSKT